MRTRAGFFSLIVSLMLVLAAPLTTPALADSIRVTVDNAAITDTQISQRAQLLRLEGRGSSSSQRLSLARQELIDDQLKMKEADRLGIKITDGQVSDAVTQLARGMRISTDNLNKVLAQNGVNPQVLRARLKAQLAWNQISQQVIAPRVQFSEQELEKKAEGELSSYDNYDYILKQVLFIIPRGSNVSQSQRTAQANQYRRSFQGCDSAVDISLSYTDVAVLDIGRRHATQLPDPIAKELAGLDIGGITSPRVSDGGVSMLAVCQKDQARDLTFVTGEVRQQEGTDKLNSAAEDYLQKLRDQANIVNR